MNKYVIEHPTKTPTSLRKQPIITPEQANKIVMIIVNFIHFLDKLNPS